jgi:hypothetical protein
VEDEDQEEEAKKARAAREAEEAWAAREVEKAWAAREAEEEERARKDREATVARDRAATGERVSERGEEVEIQGGCREGGNDEEGSTGSATAEKAHGSEGAKTTGAAFLDATTGSTDPGTSA